MLLISLLTLKDLGNGNEALKTLLLIAAELSGFFYKNTFMLTHNLEKSIREMSQNMGLKCSWLIAGGPKRKPGTDSRRGDEAMVAGCRTVGVSRVQCVCGGTAGAL